MPRRSCLLWGLGGIGKTQICLKFTEDMSFLRYVNVCKGIYLVIHKILNFSVSFYLFLMI
ncbi:hypothetical protein BYT27DRAFT_6960525 [Phlegmacium glaucopus]|nr:hypothetical protein BYT27DRAFT_6960525 [Phlegmacium glaucopus]